jgi:hypothetical protein
LVERDLERGTGRARLGANCYKEVAWFTTEALDELLGWLFVVAVIQNSADPQRPAGEVIEEIVGRYRIVAELHNASKQAEHQMAKLLEAVNSQVKPCQAAEEFASFPRIPDRCK